MNKNHVEGPAPADIAGQVQRQTYTLEEARKIVGVSRSLAYELARANKFPGARRLGGRFVVSRVALDAWLSGGEAA